jgi:hypothetical protein
VRNRRILNSSWFRYRFSHGNCNEHDSIACSQGVGLMTQSFGGVDSNCEVALGT